MTPPSANPRALPTKPVTSVDAVTIRFAGDSGDGMQLAGMQFTDTSALFGNDVSTFPDYPSEIRAPAGTIAGVSGYQIQFSSHDVFTPGDEVDTLVAMNPAALKVNLKSVKRGGTIIVNADAFTPNDLKKAGYESNPLEDGSLSSYRLVRIPMDTLNAAPVGPANLTGKNADMCKNFFALGVVYWLYGRSLEPTLKYLRRKFGKKNPAAAHANEATLRSGYNYGETCELFDQQYLIEKAKLPPGEYRRINGNEAVALGLVVAAELAGKKLFYGSYPITPATDILHSLADLKNFQVITFQAEDEICALGAAIGAAFGGAIAATGTSGPGLALKSEALGLAVMTELPVVIVNVQRGGPSTGLPTKTEQSDLFQALYGRNGECPIPVIAAASPTDCFAAAIEAVRLAVRYMTPVLLLSDGFVANSSEPWLIPDIASLKKIRIHHPTAKSAGKFKPYARNAEGVRPWALPGTPGLEHRVGGLEKQDLTGCVSYDPLNHETMVRLRAEKIARITPAGEPFLWHGKKSGNALLVSWGGTYGATKAATLVLQADGVNVAHCHLRYLNPLPRHLATLLSKFKHVIIPELNTGQLRHVLKAACGIEASGINKVRGQPFTRAEIVKGVYTILASTATVATADKTPTIWINPKLAEKKAQPVLEA
jgi:2-oxoglutarate/2-oxoacid ferredoxin oxidoreductase subunit alpha